MGILLGLVAALCWGTADFLARYATRIIGTYRTLFFMQFVGIAALTLYMLLTGDITRAIAHGDTIVWTWAIIGAIINILSSLALYRAFEVGILAIVSPIAASSAAITVLLAFITGARVDLSQGIGIVAALLGVVLAATSFAEVEEHEKRHEKLTRGVGLAIAASCGYGVLFWLLGTFVTPRIGGAAPVWVVRCMTICLLGGVARPVRQSIKLPQGRVWWFLVGVGILDTTAFVTAGQGFAIGPLAIVSVIASLFSAVTVLLAWIFLRDKLFWSQWLGIAIIFAGVVLVNI